MRAPPPLDAPRPALRVPPSPGSRVVPLSALPDLVPDGTRVALGGTWLSSRPMAAVRELLRAGRRDLHVVALTGSLDVDLLVGAGAAEAVSFCFVSLGPFGLAPRFRAALETGAVRADEHSGHGLTVALEAASRGLDFMPFYGPVGTSLADRYPTVPSPVTGAPVQVAPAERPDVAVLHAEAATPDGHVLLAGALGVDVVTARAARTVVVTAERIVDRLPASGARYLAPAEVHHVVEAPWGAHPLAHVPEHGMDWRSLLAYADAATTPEGFAVWLAADLAGSEDARRAAIGPERRAALRASGRGGPLEAPPGARPATATGDVAPHERIVVELARRLQDGDTAILGSFTPVGYAAALLARATHAPGLDFNAYGYAGTRVGWLGFLGVEGRARATGYGPIRFEDLVGSLRFGGLVAFEPVRPAQVDGSGAMNLRRLDLPGGRVVRLPGTAGAQEVLEMHRRPVGYLPDHDRRTCVPEVDDVSLRAHLPHPRRDPFTLVTSLAVLELTAKGWRVVSRHPGVTAGDLEAATGFPLLGAAAAPETPAPDPEVLAVLRERVDPLGVAATEVLGGPARRELLVGLLEAEERLLTPRA